MAKQTLAQLILLLKADTASLKTDFAKADSQISTFASGAKKLLAGIGVTLGLGKLLSEAKQAIQSFHEYNSQIEQSRIGIAGLIFSTGQLKDANNELVEGDEKWQASLEVAQDYYNRIQAAAALTAATVPEITDGFQQMIGPGRAAGLTFDEILDTSILITQTLNAMGQPMQRFRTEAFQLLTGEISRESVIANSLQITKQEVLEARERGRLADLLNEKMGSFARAGEAQTETWAGLRSTLGDVVKLVGATAQLPLFEAAKRSLREMTDLLVETSGGMLQLTKDADSAAKQLAATWEGIVLHFRTFKTEYGAILSVIGAGLQALNITVSSFFLGISSLITLMHLGGTLLLDLMDDLTFRKIPFLNRLVEDSYRRQDQMVKSLAAQAAAASKTWGEAFNILGDVSGGALGAPRETPDARLLETDPKRIAAAQQAVKDAAKKYRLGEDDFVDPAAIERATAAVDKIAQKTAELRTQKEQLVNPVQASRLAMELWIAQATEGAHQTDELKQSIQELRSAFDGVEVLKLETMTVEAVESAFLKKLSEDVKTAMVQVREEYEGGKVDLETAFEARRQVIIRAAKVEEGVLREQLKRADSEPQKIAIQAEIEAKQAQTKRTVIELTREERKEIENVITALREQQSVEVYEQAETALLALSHRYEQGMVTIQEYYSERRRLAEGIGTEEIQVLEDQLAMTEDQAEEIRITTKILEAKAQQQRENLELTRDETEALREQGMEQLRIYQTLQLASLAASGRPTGPQGDEEERLEQDLARLEEQLAQEYDDINNQKEELVLVNDEYYTKLEARELAYRGFLQRQQELHDAYERRALARKLQVASMTAGNMADAFAGLYELSGKKVEAFFYLSKAAAVAQAIVGTALAVVNALASPVPYPVAVAFAASAAAAGAVQIAVIAATTMQGPGKKEGGLITSGGARRADDVPIRVSRGEFVQPDDAVDYYGVRTMEALRRKMVPREALVGFGGMVQNINAPMTPRFDAGGSTERVIVSQTAGGHTINVPVHVSADAPVGLAADLQDSIERVVREVILRYT